MKKFLFFSFCLAFISISVHGQNLTTTIKVQAMEMAKALIRNDFANFSKYMHPKVVELAGGKENMKNKMDSADIMMKQFGASFKKILIGDPGEIISYKNTLQSVVPQTTTVQSMMGDLIAETSLIAFSTDKGKNWYFIDTNAYQVGKLKSILPYLSPGLVIPPRKKPQMVPGNKN